MNTEQDFDADVCALLRAVHDVLKLGIGRPRRKRMKEAAEVVASWYYPKSETNKEKTA